MIRRVITDRDVLTGAVSSPIVLDEHTLLTPAARDRAVQKGLVIVERGAGHTTPARAEGCGECGGDCATCGCALQGTSGGSGSGIPSLTSLPDGLHLVRVEGGRVVSALPAAGSGLMQPARGGTTP
jgi:hypothetical protein